MVTKKYAVEERIGRPRIHLRSSCLRDWRLDCFSFRRRCFLSTHNPTHHEGANEKQRDTNPKPCKCSIVHPRKHNTVNPPLRRKSPNLLPQSKLSASGQSISTTTASTRASRPILSSLLDTQPGLSAALFARDLFCVCEREGGLEDGGVSSPKAICGDLFLDDAAANSGGEGEGRGGGGCGGWYAIGSGEVCRKRDSRQGASGNNGLVVAVVAVDLFVKAVRFRASVLWGTGCWRIGWKMRGGEETSKGESYWRPMVVGRGASEARFVFDWVYDLFSFFE